MAEPSAIATTEGAKEKIQKMIDFSEYQAINELRELGITPYELIGSPYEYLATKYNYMLLPPASEEEVLMFMTGVMHGQIKEQKVTKDGDVVDVVASAETRVACAKNILSFWQNNKKGARGSANIIEIKEVQSMDDEQLMKEISEMKSSINATMNRTGVKKEMKKVAIKKDQEKVAEIREVLEDEYQDKMHKELAMQRKELKAEYEKELNKKIKVVKDGEEPKYVLRDQAKADDILKALGDIEWELSNYSTKPKPEYDEGVDN